MYGNTTGQGATGDESQPWSAVVTSTSTPSGTADSTSSTGSTAQGASADSVSADTTTSSSGVALATSTTTGADASVTSSPSAVVVESTGTADSTIDGSGLSVGIGISIASDSWSADAVGVSISIGPSASTSTVDFDGTGIGTSRVNAGSTTTTVSVVIDAVSTFSEEPETIEALAPAMLPLVNSQEDDVIESELKDLFMTLFEEYLRNDERFMNDLGMPHVGSREMIEQSLAANGLAIYRGASVASGAGAYLLRAWLAYNPRRGLHLLKTYLQLLWPNVWTCKQMWQAKSATYPAGLVEEDGGNHYLTSRVHVTLPSTVTDGGDLAAIQSGLRAALAARFVLNLAIVEKSSFGIGIVGVYYRGTVARNYEGTFK